MSSIASPIQFNEAYYDALVTSEYQGSTNMLAWLNANLQLFQDVFLCLNNFNSSFDIDQAVGAQLDILGVIIGVSRVVNFQPLGGVSPVLDDDSYRLLLKARVFGNHWNGLTATLRIIWSALFPSGVLLVTDNQDMTVSFYIAGAFSSIIQDLISNDYILPRPQGVLYTFSFATLPILGFDQDTAFVAGWDLGHFAS